ncbi:response regulator [Cohnella fermenti]|uniref:Response regulator n=1 Tax=Cohnella fermenti TaxID=2565925 RepID=A0A4S4BKI1_9BACL|nr:response regulator [Cohnella fermenti]THF75242.1 response regulator [Cohnella fermenti]
MYKLIIVDDEILVRDAIKSQMNWTEYGFECIGDCEDGIEALEFMEREQADVVLTDIGMPFMDGLELTRELAERHPDAKVVILTGYDDFDYAQRAVKLQAVDYLLKPITSVELGTVLARLRQDLDSQRNKEQDYEQLRRQLAENMPLLRERFLEQMMTSPMTDRQKREGLSYFQIGANGSQWIELAMDVDEFTWEYSSSIADQQLIRFAVYNVVTELIGSRQDSSVYRDCENRVFALVAGDDPRKLMETALQLAEESHEAIVSILPVKLSIGVGLPARLREDVTCAHRTALAALEYRFVIGLGTIIPLSDVEARERPEVLSVVAWESELVTKLKTGTPDELDEWVDKLFKAIREHLFPLPLCQLYLQRIVLTLMHTLYELDHQAARPPGPRSDPMEELALLGTLDEAQAWLGELCKQAVAKIRGLRDSQSDLQVNKALEFVKHHYKDPDLSLISVCKHISMSPSYFSVMFKQHIGKTFVEHVTDIRMEKARELLALTSMKSYEIAYEVGYSDPHYFSGAFKKHQGDTPTEYRQKSTMKKA